jgi:hypothetical protein
MKVIFRCLKVHKTLSSFCAMPKFAHHTSKTIQLSQGQVVTAGVLLHAGWREYSDIPISYEDIEEVRPAPALPPDVQAQWERAQWVLYLLRRRVSWTMVVRAFCMGVTMQLLHIIAGNAMRCWTWSGCMIWGKCCRPYALEASCTTGQHGADAMCSHQLNKQKVACPLGHT